MAGRIQGVRRYLGRVPLLSSGQKVPRKAAEEEQPRTGGEQLAKSRGRL